MNAKHKVKLAMYNAVISFCDENMTIIDSLPALKVSYSSFTQTVAHITTTNQRKMVVLTGIAENKDSARKALTRNAAALAAKVYAYANTSSLRALKAEVKFSITGLNRLKDVALPAVCRNILKAAVDNIAALTAYNVTEQTNTAFGAMITAYEALEPDPRNAVSTRVMQNASLIELFKKAEDILTNEVDKMVAASSIDHPGFFIAYESNRVIIDASTTSSRIKGTATDRSNDNPLDNATVAIAGTDITVMTNGKGKFVIKPLAPGKYTVTISKKGYETLTFWDQLVKLGQITTLNGSLPVAAEEVVSK